MKNYWLTRRKSRQTAFRFELIGCFPECDVEVVESASGAGHLCVKSTNPRFVAWIGGNGRLGATARDAQLKIYQNNSMVEIWQLYSISLVSTGMNGSPQGTEGVITFTCSNAGSVRSKFFKMN